MSAALTRVLVVEDHPLVRNLVRMACAELAGAEVVGEVGQGHRAVEEASRIHPDVIVLDLSIPGLDGLELARRLRAMGSTSRILVLTGRQQEQDLLEALRLGVDGFLDKSASSAEIAEAVRAVARGERAFTQEQELRAAAQLETVAHRARKAAAIRSRLTARQRIVLEQMANGLSAREIATQLGISERSVRTHISALYRRLGVRGRVEAVALAMELDLFPDVPNERSS
jgi:DNA-binding NarL/FixJ family response regulator